MGTASPGPGRPDLDEPPNELKSPIPSATASATPMTGDRPRRFALLPAAQARAAGPGRSPDRCVHQRTCDTLRRALGPTPRGHPAPRLDWGPGQRPITMSEVGASEASQDSRWRRGLAPATFRRLAIASAALTAAIIATGAAVRLTGSGSAARLAVVLPASPDGPALLPPAHRVLQSHGDHRLVIVVGATLVGALAGGAPFRPHLVGRRPGGGRSRPGGPRGIVVYTKLNPYLVMAHFLFSILVLVDAVVLVTAARASTTRQRDPPGAQARLLLGRGLVCWSPSSSPRHGHDRGRPHAGGSSGQLVAKRLPVALRDMAELHSSVALLLVGVVLSLVVALHAIDVPSGCGGRRVCSSACWWPGGHWLYPVLHAPARAARRAPRHRRRLDRHRHDPLLPRLHASPT